MGGGCWTGVGKKRGRLVDIADKPVNVMASFVARALEAVAPCYCPCKAGHSTRIYFHFVPPCILYARVAFVFPMSRPFGIGP